MAAVDRVIPFSLHLYLTIEPPSSVPVPDKVTISPKVFCWFKPALAVGGVLVTSSDLTNTLGAMSEPDESTCLIKIAG